MTSLWPRIEPLLAKVQKPARYIGCEDGSQAPVHGPHQAAWLLVYPDAYEVGLPNQGLQILYEILNERADAVAERSYAPWGDMEALMRQRGVPLFSVDTHRPAARLRRHRLQPLGRARLHQRPQLHRPRRGAGAGRRPRPRGPPHRGGRPLRLQPRAAGRLRRLLRHRRRRGGGRRDHRGRGATGSAAGARAGSREQVLRALSHIPGVYVPSMYDVAYDGGRLVAVTPRYADVPERVEKRTVADLNEWPYPKRQLVPLTEVVHDRLNVEIFRGLHPRLPVLPGGHDHPPGAGALGRPGAHDGARRAAAHRLRRGHPHLAVERRLQRDRPRRRRHHQRARQLQPGVVVACPACASTRSRSAWPPRSRRCGARASRSPPRAAPGASARCSTS